MHKMLFINLKKKIIVVVVSKHLQLKKFYRIMYHQNYVKFFKWNKKLFDEFNQNN